MIFIDDLDGVVKELEEKGVVVVGIGRTDRMVSLLKLTMNFFKRPVRAYDICVYIKKILDKEVTRRFKVNLEHGLMRARKQQLVFVVPVRSLGVESGPSISLMLHKSPVFHDVVEIKRKRAGTRGEYFYVCEKKQIKPALDYFRRLLEEESNKIK